MNNIPSWGSVQDEIIFKVRHKLDSILKVNERCIEGCAPPRQGDVAVYGVREILVCPLSAQLQDSFIVPCVIRKLTVY